MGKVIDVQGLADMLDEEIYDAVWFNYSLGNNFRTRGGTKNAGGYRQIGARSTINRNMFVNQVIIAYNKSNFDKILGFYPGVILYVLGNHRDKITWIEDTDFTHTKFNKCMKNLHFPIELKEKLEEIWDSDPNFEEFLEEIKKKGDTAINMESALEVYKMQGKKAIFGILGQIFSDYSYSNNFSCHLLPNLDIIWTPKVENLVSGCVFPVCVSPFVNNFRISRTPNEAIMQAFWQEKWWDFDIFATGQFNLWCETLNQRRNYLRNEAVLPTLVCDNWFEVVQACNYWGSDVIIREMGHKLLNSRWFKFGKGGEIAVRFEGKQISAPYVTKTVPKVKIDDKQGNEYGIMQLNGKFIKGASKKDVVYSFEEIRDWFELANMIE